MTARDATPRIDAEIRLLRLATMERTHVRTLEAVIEAMADGVALIGPDGTITISNEALALMAGGPVGNRADLERALGISSEGGDAIQESGRRFSIDTHDIQDGPIQSTLLVARDVTEERRSAAERDAFIGVLSHELRTPVTTIVGFAELMLRRPADPATPRADLLPDIAAEANRLGQLIEDLLVLSRSQTGRITIELEPVLLDRLIQDAVASESGPLSDGHVRYRRDRPATTRRWRHDLSAPGPPEHHRQRGQVRTCQRGGPDTRVHERGRHGRPGAG